MCIYNLLSDCNINYDYFANHIIILLCSLLYVLLLLYVRVGVYSHPNCVRKFIGSHNESPHSFECIIKYSR